MTFTFAQTTLVVLMYVHSWFCDILLRAYCNKKLITSQEKMKCVNSYLQRPFHSWFEYQMHKTIIVFQFYLKYFMISSEHTIRNWLVLRFASSWHLFSLFTTHYVLHLDTSSLLYWFYRAPRTERHIAGNNNTQ